MKKDVDINTDDKRLEQIFGEAMGTQPDTEETAQAWQTFIGNKQNRVGKRTVLYRTVTSVAAVLVLALGFLWLLRPQKASVEDVPVYTSLDVPQDVTTLTIGNRVVVSTPPATIAEVPLSDGTMVLLSANSRLEYDKDFSETERAVSLVGEARFEVAKDDARPFVVHAGDLQTTVLGTVFNVKTYPQCTSAVQLYKGSVRVDVKDRKSVVMTPGEELSVVEGYEITMNRTGVEEKGWSRNEFLFDNSDLKSVMQEIGTWYNMDVVFASCDLLDERIYFRISRDLSCGELLQILNDLQIASFREENGKIRVLPSNS